MKRILPVIALVAIGCGGPPVWSTQSPTPASKVSGPPSAATTPKTRLEIHWARNSAEHRAAFLQTYRFASDQIRILARGKTPGRWGVILDGDETTLDNSTYQKRRADIDSAYTEASWGAWVRERSAPALPGAVEFTRLVHDLGGKVVIVTNRDETLCAATRDNFVSDGFPIDLVLCKPAGPSDKNPRFRAVQEGTASPGLPALQVLMWVGDNIQDFPNLTQALRDSSDTAFADFGRRFIMLPNPMYGSWERNPYR